MPPTWLPADDEDEEVAVPVPLADDDSDDELMAAVALVPVVVLALDRLLSVVVGELDWLALVCLAEPLPLVWLPPLASIVAVV